MNKDNTYISIDFDGTLHQNEKLQHFITELKQNNYHFGVTTRRTNIYPNNKAFNRVFPQTQVLDICKYLGIDNINFIHLERKVDFFKRLFNMTVDECIIIHIDDDQSEIDQISLLNKETFMFANNKKIFCFHISEWIEFINFVREVK